MLPRRIVQQIMSQNWPAVGLELLVVFIGVYAGIAAANWNEARQDSARKQQIVAALITDITDSIGVQEQFIEQIDAGLSAWEQARARGDTPAPYYFRTTGSDTAPDTWGLLRETGLVDLFDPNTLFDLSFYFSELQGVGIKYLRYIVFVESRILPFAQTDAEVFYDQQTQALRPEFRANMERLREFREESQRLIHWAECLVFRLQADRSYESSCARAGFVLEGMREE
jgi:hypothetical protein